MNTQVAQNLSLQSLKEDKKILQLINYALRKT